MIGSVVKIPKNASYFNEIDKSVNGFINGQKFIVPTEEIHYRPIDWNKHLYPKNVERMITEGFTAEVIDEYGEILILSRKKSQIKEYEMLKIGAIVDAKIIGITRNAVFIEFNNGLTAIIYIGEFSRTRMVPMNTIPKYLNLNDKIKVEILNKKENRIYASRKRVYPVLKEVADSFKVGSVIPVTPTKRMNFDGMWAEVTPNIMGILNASEYELNRLEIGEKVLARVQRIKEKGLKLHLVK